MRPEVVVAFEFVEFIPDEVKERTLYISIPYCTAVHNCFCGCGREVVTPLSPTAWQLIFDGKTVSLQPSIGSWGLPCQSHYFLTANRVVWASKWSDKRIAKGRAREANARERYFAAVQGSKDSKNTRSASATEKIRRRTSSFSEQLTRAAAGRLQIWSLEPLSLSGIHGRGSNA